MCQPESTQLMSWTRRNNKAQQKSTTIVVLKDSTGETSEQDKAEFNMETDNEYGLESDASMFTYKCANPQYINLLDKKSVLRKSLKLW